MGGDEKIREADCNIGSQPSLGGGSLESMQVDETNDGWDIGVDVAYGSRGFSTVFCNVLAGDLEAFLHNEVVH
ncbi:hypothetical protein Y032_0806g2445 [Ancylostoma ceylanicum]|uniref:Uncharacterized protein n=1 Tax=Ancylostoma ceylanicum TaxID=53326 RepID=A0A016WE62_9BILA|nr:hypothetical protein Y032_0806g2445 [Ancylostoma ceylanicum]